MLQCKSHHAKQIEMRYQGHITTWKDEKGFGFITPIDGGEQVFVHISDFSDRQRPSGNELVSYDLTIDGKGRPQGLCTRTS
jgi:cold shock CspA family protein